eukprot:3290722-Amphidinium_carterae.1
MDFKQVFYDHKSEPLLGIHGRWRQCELENLFTTAHIVNGQGCGAFSCSHTAEACTRICCGSCVTCFLALRVRPDAL